MEPIETQVSKRWQLRMVLVAFGFAVFAAWFAYDGAVGYPAFNERASLHNQLVVEEARRDEWLALAKERGWSPTFDTELLDAWMRVKPKSRTDIQVQLGLAVFCLLVALALAARVLLNRGLFMVLDDEGLVTFAGQRVPFSSILSIDKSRWERKSIAVVHFIDGKGRRCKVVLDDWIYAGMDDILERLETLLPEPVPAKPPEPTPAPPAEDEV